MTKDELAVLLGVTAHFLAALPPDLPTPDVWYDVDMDPNAVVLDWIVECADGAFGVTVSVDVNGQSTYAYSLPELGDGSGLLNGSDDDLVRAFEVLRTLTS